VEVDWRNAAYAVQWWIFALFAIWLYLRMLREESARGSAGAVTASSSVPPPTRSPDPVAVPAVGAGENVAREHS
ncbi:MAG: hypothetical protein ACRCY8_12270, partial [Dermatophilaceae bacterium]